MMVCLSSCRSDSNKFDQSHQARKLRNPFQKLTGADDACILATMAFINLLGGLIGTLVSLLFYLALLRTYLNDYDHNDQ